jgi:hypothetical protein
LPLSEVRSITVALLLLLSTLLFFSLYNESYYFFSILIMYIFMLPKIFSAVTKNLKRLGVQLAFVTRLYDERARLGQRLPPHMPRLSTLHAKLRLFKWLKVLLLFIYLLLTIYFIRVLRFIFFFVLVFLFSLFRLDYGWVSGGGG